MSQAFFQQRLQAQQNLAIAYEDAIAALVAGDAEYTLDTGQTKQTVKAHDLEKLQTALDRIYNNIVTLELRCNGGGVTIGVPSC